MNRIRPHPPSEPGNRISELRPSDAPDGVSTRPIDLNAARLLRIPVGIALLLVGISLGLELVRYMLERDHVYGLLVPLETLFNLDLEQNFPSLFSTLSLFTAAALLGVIALLTGREGDADRGKWLVLCGGFLFLTIDESCSLHERLIDPLRAAIGPRSLGIFHFAWVIPALVLIAAFGLFFLRFVLRLPATTRILIIASGALYLGGAVGIEMLGGRYAKAHGEANLPYQLFVHLEESLEIAGILLFIYTLLRYLAERWPDLAVTFGRSPQA